MFLGSLKLLLGSGISVSTTLTPIDRISIYRGLLQLLNNKKAVPAFSVPGQIPTFYGFPERDFI
jgi:hypothetical protein